MGQKQEKLLKEDKAIKTNNFHKNTKKCSQVKDLKCFLLYFKVEDEFFCSSYDFFERDLKLLEVLCHTCAKRWQQYPIQLVHVHEAEGSFKCKNCKNVIKPFGRDRNNRDLHSPFQYPMGVWRMMAVDSILLSHNTDSFFEYNREPLNERVPTDDGESLNSGKPLNGTEFLDDVGSSDGTPPFDVKEFWENMVPWDHDDEERVDEIEFWEGREPQNNVSEIDSGVEDI